MGRAYDATVSTKCKDGLIQTAQKPVGKVLILPLL